jgi:Bacterial regulatory protein, Fis family
VAVKKAISDAGGNLSRAAALLGCTRATLYKWCYQLGLERFAGIGMPTLHTPPPPGETPLNATVKVTETLWKRVKIEAIRQGCTVSEYVSKALEAALADKPGNEEDVERQR